MRADQALCENKAAHVISRMMNHLLSLVVKVYPARPRRYRLTRCRVQRSPKHSQGFIHARRYMKDMTIQAMITSNINISTEKKSEIEARDVVKRDDAVCDQVVSTDSSGP